nr:MAG TPA: hypothetical protein [Caudoviricetes sp.]
MVFFLQKLIIVERVLNKTLFILYKKRLTLSEPLTEH